MVRVVSSGGSGPGVMAASEVFSLIVIVEKTKGTKFPAAPLKGE
jgi:hypothetical protein